MVPNKPCTGVMPECEDNAGKVLKKNLTKLKTVQGLNETKQRRTKIKEFSHKNSRLIHQIQVCE